MTADPCTSPTGIEGGDIAALTQAWRRILMLCAGRIALRFRSRLHRSEEFARSARRPANPGPGATADNRFSVARAPCL